MAGAGKPGMWLVETISFGNLATLWMWPFAETSSSWSPAASVTSVPPGTSASP
jgi:hypothetical protein